MLYIITATYKHFSISRTEKEKAKFQQEVYELLAQIENANKDKVMIAKIFKNKLI